MWAHERWLCLAVAKSGSALALRYSTAPGRRRLMTLQQYQPIDAAGLKALEWQAAELRKLIEAGRDPLAERDADNAATATAGTTVGRTTVDTFEEVARNYIAQHKDGWKNAKHLQQWEYAGNVCIPDHRQVTPARDHDRRRVEGLATLRGYGPQLPKTIGKALFGETPKIFNTDTDDDAARKWMEYLQ